MQNKARLTPVIIGISLVLIASLLWAFVFKTPACSVVVDGEKKFAVANKSQAEKTINKIKLAEEKNCAKKLELANNIEFKRSLVKKSSIIKTADMEKEFQQILKFKTLAAGLEVKGEPIAYLTNSAEAEKLLKRIKSTYEKQDEGEKLVELAFVEKVKIVEKTVEVGELISPEDAYTLITTGSKNPEKYIVEEGDSLWLIARRNDMYVDEIVKANSLTKEDLSLGQELILVKSKPYLNVMAKVEGEKVEAIPFETVVETDKNSTTSIRVKQNGKDGQKQIAYKATKINGIIEEREITKETVLEKAIDKIIVKGSAVTVASRGGSPVVGSGALDWPTSGSITNGYRSAHTAIDIATRTGSPIRAADSGYVTFTGWQGGYGNFVIIDHGNGIVTRYAHCNSINVSTGQRVVKGENIATVGSTGRSTGPHLHFEVLAGGSFKNPLSYLR